MTARRPTPFRDGFLKGFATGLVALATVYLAIRILQGVVEHA